MYGRVIGELPLLASSTWWRISPVHHTAEEPTAALTLCRPHPAPDPSSEESDTVHLTEANVIGAATEDCPQKLVADADDGLPSVPLEGLKSTVHQDYFRLTCVSHRYVITGASILRRTLAPGDLVALVHGAKPIAAAGLPLEHPPD